MFACDVCIVSSNRGGNLRLGVEATNFRIYLWHPSHGRRYQSLCSATIQYPTRPSLKILYIQHISKPLSAHTTHINMKFIAVSIAALAASTSALGINCRGSGLCPSDGAAGNLINLKAIVDGIQPRNRAYSTGQQIACTGSLCTYYQNGATGTAEQASGFLQALLDHGCHKCGSCPTQAGNNVDNGELTANVVGDAHCQGAC